MLEWLSDRLKEPSTHAGLAALAATLGASGAVSAAAATFIVAGLGMLAVILGERKPG